MTRERLLAAGVFILAVAACSSQADNSEAGPVIPQPADAIVRCGAEVPYEQLNDAEPADPSDPAWLAVAAMTAENPGEMGHFPDQGWIVMKRTDEEAVFGILSTVDSRLQVLAVKATATDEGWRGAGSVGGRCPLTVALADDLTPLDWVVDSRRPYPGPQATEVHPLASESCAFGNLAQRLRTPTVKETDEEVLIALAAEPARREALDCPIGGPVAVQVDLETPLGDRTIADGLVMPTPDLAAP